MLPTLIGARLADARVADVGLDPEQIEELIPAALAALDEPHDNAAAIRRLSEEIDERGLAAGGTGADEVARWAWWAIRHVAPLRHHPTGGSWSFGDRPSYRASATPWLAGPAEVRRPVADHALRRLIRRYLAGFGPASVADIAQFAMVQRGRIRPVLEQMRDELVEYSVTTGPPVVDLVGARVVDGNIPAPARLLPMWDSTLLAYHDRSRILPEALRRVVIRTGGDTLPSVLIDGVVGGVWRSIAAGATGGERGDASPAVEVTLFEEYPPRVWDEIAGQADAMRSFLSARDPEPYRRHHRWWAHLPADAVTRVL